MAANHPLAFSPIARKLRIVFKHDPIMYQYIYAKLKTMISVRNARDACDLETCVDWSRFPLNKFWLCIMRKL